MSAGAAAHRVQRWRVALRQIDLRAPFTWPAALRHALCAAVFLGMLALLGVVWLAAALEVRDAQRLRSVALRDEQQRKQAETAPLAGLRTQRDQAQRQVAGLERQLIGTAELDPVLADIQRAGVGRGLQLTLLRPGAAVLRPHHAEQPVALRLTGRYHDIGLFAADLGRLPHLVSLGSMALTPHKEGLLAMTATVRTFRRLDPAEEAAQRAARVSVPAGGASAPMLAPTVDALPARVAPLSYTAADTLDPFDVRKLAPTQGAPSSVDAPARRVEVLETVPLDAIEWVGRLQRAGRTVALVEADRKLHAVRIGQCLGPDRGRVARIGDDALVVREQVREADGAWVERQVTLRMRAAQEEK